MSTNDQNVRLFKGRAPNDLRVFTFPPSSILRLDRDVVVIGEAISDSVALRNFASCNR